MRTGTHFARKRSNYRSITDLRMSDMRSPPLLQGARRDHNVWTLSFRVALMSPSSSGAGVRLSLLEGDCVGPTRPILKAGLLRARLFFYRTVFPLCGFHHEKNCRPVDSGTAAPHPPPMITNPGATAVKKASLSGASDRRAR